MRILVSNGPSTKDKEKLPLGEEREDGGREDMCLAMKKHSADS